MFQPADLNTILAALRHYQATGQGNPDNRSDPIHQIATNGGDDISLDDRGIDDLCERLNGGCGFDVIDALNAHARFLASLPDPKAQLRVVLKDEAGVVIEAFDAPALDAVTEVGRFVLLHGFDPNELGAAASAGSIEFEPVRAEEEVPCR